MILLWLLLQSPRGEEPTERLMRLEGFASDCQKEKLRAYAETHEKEGMRKAYQNVIEILKLRDNGSTV